MNKMVVFAISAFAVVVASAGVMNWRVADESLSNYNYARVLYADSNTTEGGTPLATSMLEEGYGDEKQIDVSSLNASTAYFYIEVGNYKDGNFTKTMVAGAYAYNDLVSAGLISTGSMNPPTGGSFGDSSIAIPNHSGSMYGPVPEPGTASLILVGLAIAGLKRRRA